MIYQVSILIKKDLQEIILAKKISIDLKFKMLRVFNSNKYKNLDLLNQFKILSKI